MSPELDVVIVGAGVVGLAIAVELASKSYEVCVFERNRTFGLETSSHNSEVIHSGIYHAGSTLKGKFCLEGKPMTYELCEKYQVGHRRIGKIIIAADAVEERELEHLYRQGTDNGLDDLQMLTRQDVKRLEPNVKAIAGLLSPSTGIIDSYGFARSFYGRAQAAGASFVFNSEVIGIDKIAGGYIVTVRDREGISSVATKVVINSAGLYADKIATMAGIDIDKADYRIHYCKGFYYCLSPRLSCPVNRLVYPVPEQAGLGIHITLSVDGRLRLGPNFRYVDTVDYSIDDIDKNDFYHAACRYIPSIEPEDLSPESSGIRPKLQGPGESFRDFVIRDEADKGLPGLIDLIGIESPGLTGSPSIAGYVADMLKPYLD